MFWLMMDRNSNDFDAGVGKLKYIKGTGKFESYGGTECLYAINFACVYKTSCFAIVCAKLHHFEGSFCTEPAAHV